MENEAAASERAFGLGEFADVYSAHRQTALLYALARARERCRYNHLAASNYGVSGHRLPRINVNAIKRRKETGR